MITVGISDMKVGGQADILVTYALGSCVGICLYDPMTKNGALGHILLPASGDSADLSNEFKFADTCIRHMVTALEQRGCAKRNLYAKMRAARACSR
jgi:chemotaxis protein CheD